MDNAVFPPVAPPVLGGSAGPLGRPADREASDANCPEELGVVTYVHRYLFSLKFLTWATLAIVAVMGFLYFLVGFPPAFDGYFAKMYFHSIGIGLAALAVYLVIHAFKLQRYEPPIDFPMVYRAFIAVVLGALGGLVYLSPSVSNALPDVGILLFTAAFILIGDVGGALYIELVLLPRKLVGSYDEQSRTLFDYLGRVVPISKADRSAYSNVGIGYWLTLAAIGSAFVAGVLGFFNLWVRVFGPSFFGGFISWLGLDKQGWLDATLDPHSHMMALAIMAGIVAVAAVLFHVFDSESPRQRTVAVIGAWIALIGVIATTLVLGAVALLNFAPPTLFASGPGGINGMAGDDMVMAVIGAGSMIVLLAIIVERRVWRDPLRLTVLATWVAAMVINVGQGFYIELHQDQFAASLAANDSSFKIAQPMTGIFLLTMLSLVLLLVDVYGVAGRARRIASWTAGLGLLGAFVGVTLWTFADPANNGISFGIYIAGTALSYLAVLFGAFAIRAVKVAKPVPALP
jgi:hypothetical protein